MIKFEEWAKETFTADFFRDYPQRMADFHLGWRSAIEMVVNNYSKPEKCFVLPDDIDVETIKKIQDAESSEIVQVTMKELNLLSKVQVIEK